MPESPLTLHVTAPFGVRQDNTLNFLHLSEDTLNTDGARVSKPAQLYCHGRCPAATPTEKLGGGGKINTEPEAAATDSQAAKN